ncbi:hypothetical protein GGS23DRAFT_551635 [Durotheca rogersii]|uniref:uncharacterized protein n=1 Tax=Durotheca rogersii TaxID=419775 RepID=UPI0022204474|nr:uncharacterized protein GGS23DRAFT_551635 [Durotheca rogersii]KAI5866694.1 hypothetical protein GGS23DRAFT_551635 [Durotheca rogersii]
MYPPIYPPILCVAALAICREGRSSLNPSHRPAQERERPREKRDPEPLPLRTLLSYAPLSPILGLGGCSGVRREGKGGTPIDPAGKLSGTRRRKNTMEGNGRCVRREGKTPTLADVRTVVPCVCDFAGPRTRSGRRSWQANESQWWPGRMDSGKATRSFRRHVELESERHRKPRDKGQISQPCFFVHLFFFFSLFRLWAMQV